MKKGKESIFGYIKIGKEIVIINQCIFFYNERVGCKNSSHTIICNYSSKIIWFDPKLMDVKLDNSCKPFLVKRMSLSFRWV